jgi:F0F1-type ATP synthase assembly protein I
LTVNGENKRPEPPSPDEYGRLQKNADQLRQSALSDRSDKEVKRRRQQEGLHAYVRYTGIGLQFALVMALPTGAGYLLDGWLGTLPWITVVGAVFGGVGAMVWVVRAVDRMENRDDRK